MYVGSGELTVILITIWWLQKLVSKQEPQKFDGEKFNLGKLKELEIRKQYQIEITNRFAAFGNLSDNEDINRA